MLGKGLNFITQASAECFTPKDPTLHSGSGVADSIRLIPMLLHTANFPRACPGAPYHAPGMDTQLSPKIARRCHCGQDVSLSPAGMWVVQQSPHPAPCLLVPHQHFPCAHTPSPGGHEMPRSLNMGVSTRFHMYLQTALHRFMNKVPKSCHSAIGDHYT